jgi:hypothetical protein
MKINLRAGIRVPESGWTILAAKTKVEESDCSIYILGRWARATIFKRVRGKSK